MTREERAELTIRVAGIVFLTQTLGGLVPLATFAELLRPQFREAPGVLGSAVASLAMVLTGYGFVFRSRRIAGLLRPRDESEEGREAELLCAGIFLLGVHYAFDVCLTVTTALTDGEATGAGLAALFTALATALFLARPRALITWLARRARAGAQDGGLGGLVGAGIALVALAILMHSLSWAWSLAVSRPNPPPMPALAVWRAGASVRAYMAAASSVALALLALASCGRIGSWLARGAGETPLAVAARMGRRGWIVFGIVCVPLGGALRALFYPDGLYPSEFPVPYSVVQAAVLIGFPLLAAFVARRIARRLYPQEPDQPDSRSALVVALETAITVLVLYYGLAAIALAGITGGPYFLRIWRNVLLLALLLLALKGDVARWYARPPAEPQDARPVRAAMLRPWLGLLGAYLLLLKLPGLPGLVATALGWISSPTVAAVGEPSPYLMWPMLLLPLAGLVLVLAARPLSRALSYGPLLRTLWRWWRDLGWKKRSES
jgi:hypothetical protein